MNTANAGELSSLYKVPTIEYICVWKQLSPNPKRKLHTRAIHALKLKGNFNLLKKLISITHELNVIKHNYIGGSKYEILSVGPKIELSGIFRYIKEKQAKRPIKPITIIGLRPQMTVLVPNIPNIEPPVNKLK